MTIVTTKSRLEMLDSCGPLVKVLSSQLLLPICFSAPDGYKLSRLGSALRFRLGLTVLEEKGRNS